MKQLIATGLIVAASVTSAWAQPAQGAAIDIGNPWVRATVAQQKSTGAFMQLTARADTRLVAAQSPVAGVVEIHEMVMDRDVMKMRAMPAGLALPAGQTVELKPGGYHVMLLDLKGQVKEGDTVPLTLVFEGQGGQRETLEIQAPARPLNSASATHQPAGGPAAHGAPAAHGH